MFEITGKMTSPFHEEIGVQQRHGDIEFEWLSLLNTPCYGFSGPNACYSSTCSHNPSSSSKPEKQLVKSKLSNSTKFPFKYHTNANNSSNCERAADYNAYNSSSRTTTTTYLSMQRNAYVYSKNTYNTYNNFEING